MPANTLSILKPSVNNLSVRVFLRAAGLDLGEVDMCEEGTPPSSSPRAPSI
jgi:glutathione S-transferase